MTDDLVKRLREHAIHLDAWGKEASHDAGIVEEIPEIWASDEDMRQFGKQIYFQKCIVNNDDRVLIEMEINQYLKRFKEKRNAKTI